MLTYFYSIVLVISLVLQAAQCSHFSRSVLHGSVDIPPGWSSVGAPQLSLRLRFYVALKQRRLDELEAKLLRVASPKSPSYSQWLSREEILDIIAPPVHAQDEVVAFLLDHGVSNSDLMLQRDSISVEAAVSTINSLFAVNMELFQRRGSEETVCVHRDDLTIPTRLMQLIDMVSPLSLFPPSARRHTVQRMFVQPILLPSHLLALYHVPAGLRASNPKNSIAGRHAPGSECLRLACLPAARTVTPLVQTSIERSEIIMNGHSELLKVFASQAEQSKQLFQGCSSEGSSLHPINQIVRGGPVARKV